MWLIFPSVFHCVRDRDIIYGAFGQENWQGGHEAGGRVNTQAFSVLNSLILGAGSLPWGSNGMRVSEILQASVHLAHNSKWTASGVLMTNYQLVRPRLLNYKSIVSHGRADRFSLHFSRKKNTFSEINKCSLTIYVGDLCFLTNFQA